MNIRMWRPAAEIRAELHSCPEEVESFCLAVRPELAARAPADAFALELLLREALANAMDHGGRGDPEKRIRCVIRINNKRALISVTDQGPGFDWRTVSQRDRGTDAESGRGLQLYRTYATALRFSRNGTSLTLMKRSVKKDLCKI
jgi:serine/threonine-protein kinase RsbW